MARQGSKRQNAIEIMSANSDKPMSVVVPMIAAANDISEANARSYYKWIVENKMAPGVVVGGKATVVKTAAHTVQQAPVNFADHMADLAAQLPVSPTEVLADAAEELEVDLEAEEAAIRAANLQKIKDAAEKFNVAD